MDQARRRWRWLWASACIVVSLEGGCKEEIVPEPYTPTSAHDAYLHSLREAQLLQTALGRDWQERAEAALRSPIEVRTPFVETLYIDESKAFATSYQFELKRGQRTEIQLSLQTENATRIFVDLFRVPEEEGQTMEHVASGNEGDLRLAFEPRRDAAYLLRLQSELLRGGNCTVEIRNTASLEFPVAGRDTSSIGSVFGAEREGGRRQHHGVDIFAPRHTDVLATSRARVRLVDDWKLGGRVVWLEDRQRGLRLYFAHLQTQDVVQGTWVEPGDKIGTVGNSGNARTTPPHLHFGIYVRGEGPLDPTPFIFEPKTKPRPVVVDLAPLGGWLRTSKRNVALKPRPRASNTSTTPTLPLHTPLRVVGGSERSYRVELPNGQRGYVASGQTESWQNSVELVEVRAKSAVLDRPSRRAAIHSHVEPGTRIAVKGRFRDLLMIESPEENHPRPGWLRAATALGDLSDSAASATSP